MFLSKHFRHFTQHLRCYTHPLSSTAAETDLQFKPKFTTEEQAKILSIVNQENVETLAKFDMSRGRIKHLEMWRAKHGPFRSLPDILEVEGFGEKVLERLCKSILLNRVAEPIAKPSVLHRMQFVTPQVERDVLNNVQSAVGIHTCATGVSWARVTREHNTVHDWSFQDCSLLPKKMTPIETYQLAVQIQRQLPAADVYVMEAVQSVSPSSPQAAKAMPAYNQHMELTSMLLALINSDAQRRSVDVAPGDEPPSEIHNRVYYLRAYLAARLFKTLVGTERVSSGSIIEKLLNGADDLPCTRIATSDRNRTYFAHQSGVHKDLLGQSLMVTLAFMDLCVYRNLSSLNVMSRGRKI